MAAVVGASSTAPASLYHVPATSCGAPLAPEVYQPAGSITPSKCCAGLLMESSVLHTAYGTMVTLLAPLIEALLAKVIGTSPLASNGARKLTMPPTLAEPPVTSITAFGPITMLPALPGCTFS